MLVHKFLENAVKKTPDKKAVICQGSSCTYIQLYDRMDQWAKTLISLGIEKGDRVAMFMKNRVEMVQLYFACFRIGAIAVPLNTRYKMPEAEYALSHSGSKILIASAELYPEIMGIESDIASLTGVYLIDEGAGQQSLSWMKAVQEAGDHVNLPDVDLNDPAIILYTSGSTARPKGAVHTNYSLYNHVLNKTQSQELGKNEIGLAATQLCHIAAFAGILLPTIFNGGTFVAVKEFEAEDYIRYLKAYKPTILILLPTELLEILEHADAKDADFSHIQSMLVAGDKVPHHTYELFRKLIGFDLLEGCGMTECEGYCFQPKHEKKKPGSIGKPITGVRMRIVDKDCVDLPDGETGEILLQARSLISEYWDVPEVTRKAFENGWFRTGDLAYKDEDGYYHFVSRIKEIIIRGGSNIAPGEVEDVLDDHPNVKSSGVIGFPDKHYGSIVGAFIVPEPGMPAPAIDDLCSFASKRLAQYKVPEEWIFVENLPRNAVGKIDRRKLHRLAEEYVAT